MVLVNNMINGTALKFLKEIYPDTLHPMFFSFNPHPKIVQESLIPTVVIIISLHTSQLSYYGQTKE